MFLNRLFLQNFRSYSKSEFDFSKETTLIVGPNTAGKTNLLEGIFLLAHGKSFRPGEDWQILCFNEEVGRVKGIIEEREETKTLEIVFATGKVVDHKPPVKRYLVNGLARRQMDFVGNLRCVYFGPEDLNLVTNSPSLRRNFLDWVLEQVDWEYRRAVLTYEKALRQRNRVLEKVRSGQLGMADLEYWTKLLSEFGPQISQKRQDFVNFLNRQAKTFEDLEVFYEKNIISEERLKHYAQKEVAAGLTLVGPQRDDFKILANPKKRDLSLFGSRGEQRLAVLELKLGELEFLFQKGGRRPVLLLDDIFSELDKEHINLVLEMIGGQQTIITTTHQEFLPKSLLEKTDMIELG